MSWVMLPRDEAMIVTDALPLVVKDPVVTLDGVLHLRHRRGFTDTLLGPLRDWAGKEIKAFVPGWHADLLYSGFAPFLILEFSNMQGERAAWLLDPQHRRLGDRLDDLPADQLASLRDVSSPVLRRMMVDILMRPLPVLSREAQAFAELNDVLRTALSEGGGEAVLASPRVVLGADLPADITCGGGAIAQATCVLSGALLREGFSVALEERLVAATRDGVLTWPSPIDGRPLRCQGSIYFDDFRFAYRFADIAANLTFYVLASDHYCKALGIYVPQGDLLVAADEWSRHLLGVYFPAGITRWFINQAALNGPLLVPYFVHGARRIVSVMRGQPGTHLGHQLWNELSGIEYLLSSARGSHIPDWIVPGSDADGQGVELWGPVDQLFPELRGHVLRGLRHPSHVMLHIYRQGLCAVRITREHVSAEMRRRLQRTTQMHPAYARAREQERAARSRGAPVLILGLRVENRTTVDLVGFFADIISDVARTRPGAILVIDGHNAREAAAGSVIHSHGEALAARSPLSVEREVAQGLREHARGLDVTVLDTLGAPMAESLAWGLLADGFLSIWGASLAKYRWVCNKPGLVVSSRANLLHRDDLHIYDAPRYMEQPATLLFADAEAVIDDPEAPRLVPVQAANPFFANFRADHARIAAQFRDLLSEVLGAEAAEGRGGPGSD